MAMASERVDGVVEHLLDALELRQPQHKGLGRVEAVRLLAVDVGQAPRDQVRRNRRASRATRSPQSSTAALQMYLPWAPADSYARMCMAPRHVVDVDVPHPPVHRELRRLSCNHSSSVRLIAHPFINLACHKSTFACILFTKVQSGNPVP